MEGTQEQAATLDNVLGQIEKTGGYTPPAPATDPAPDTSTPINTSTPATPAPTTTPAAPAAPAAPAEEVATPEQIFTGNKQNAAFAQMRTANKRYADTLTRLGRSIGIDDLTDPDKIATQVEERLQTYEAQQSNVPLPILQQLEQTKRLQLEQEQELNKQAALQSFQKVKDTYGLDDKGLQDFAMQLDQLGKNPFVTPMDLINEYRILNYDALMEKERQKAIADERARVAKAADHSSAPSAANGAPPAQITAVKSTNDMTQFLKSLGVN